MIAQRQEATRKTFIHRRSASRLFALRFDTINIVKVEQMPCKGAAIIIGCNSMRLFSPNVRG